MCILSRHLDCFSCKVLYMLSSSSCYSHRVYLLHILLCSISYIRRLFMPACLPASSRRLHRSSHFQTAADFYLVPLLGLLFASQYFVPVAWVFINISSQLPRLAHKTPPSAFHCFKYSLPSMAVPDSVCSQFSATFSMRFATKGVNCAVKNQCQQAILSSVAL